MEPLWYQCKETLEPEQEISRKKSILIHLISLLEWAKGVPLTYLFNYSYNPAKRFNSTLNYPYFDTWQLSEYTHFQFNQFRPDLIAPINFGSKRTSPWSRQVSAALIMAPSHYLSQCWLIVNKILRNIFNEIQSFAYHLQNICYFVHVSMCYWEPKQMPWFCSPARRRDIDLSRNRKWVVST